MIELGDRLEITGEYDPGELGSALHAVIAAAISGQQATARILRDHGMEKTLSTEMADACASRLLNTIEQRFHPVAMHAEYPVYYTNAHGQLISGWIDLLLQTSDGFVLIDHKASPRSRSDWEEIALGYSGQLQAYAQGIVSATGRPVVSQWIHFGVTGGLVGIDLA